MKADTLQSMFVLNLVNKFRAIDPTVSVRLWCEPCGLNGTRWVLVQEDTNTKSADVEEGKLNKILNYANVADPDNTNAWTIYTNGNCNKGIHKIEKIPYSDYHKRMVGSWYYTPIEGDGYWKTTQIPAGRKVEYTPC